MPETPGHPRSSAPADHQLHQLSCILDSYTISASYEVSQAQKALLLLPRTEKDLALLQKSTNLRTPLTRISFKSTSTFINAEEDKAHVRDSEWP